jgi:hypothetical protein
VMVRVPLRAPEAVGVNVTLIVQLVLEGNVAGQLVVCPKLPDTATLEIVTALAPVFVTVTA